ncbi:carboxypeptidase-like regulatory domain-containing protein [Aridibaculum aurantiacum]|uniref:carboxypeptidase-like regulatory domain-containing protein n=1 Tax=Aridibaculum aurantiacum TaxID=2810307 RepID=UPI001A962034|nr:carboxypeptidase-like regulatory domain-containing protein [Aridibaculum aurantiacum]
MRYTIAWGNRGILFFLFLLFVVVSHAQVEIKGRVVAATGEAPIAGASVYLNNTSFGTATGSTGEFSFNVPAGKYDLVVSSVGFETYFSTVQTATATAGLVIQLQPRVAVLDEVVIATYDKDGWNNWGKFFIDNFIGTSDLASSCRILNPQVLKFRHDKQNKILTVVANEPLIIQNKALGYIINYDLQQFQFNFSTRYLLFVGYPLFKNMDGRAAQLRRWQAKREDVFYGSMTHFMRALYRNKIDEEGFEVRRLVKKPNVEKQRVKQIMDRQAKVQAIASRGNTVVTNFSKDSASYYQRVMHQPNEVAYLLNTLLPGDSIAYAIDSVTAGLSFTDYLQVFYKHKKAPPAYYSNTMMNSSEAMVSEFYLVNGHEVEVQSNGSVYPPTELLTLGYWAWSEKMCSMLPLNYVPVAKQ